MTYFAGLRNIPAKRKHTLAEYRPWQLHVGWGLMLVSWLGMLGASVVGMITSPKTSGTDVFWVTFWGLAVSALLVRGWWGGPSAWTYLKLLAQVLGVLTLVGLVAITAVELPYAHLEVSLLIYYVPGLLGGLALLTAGLLLNTRHVRLWYAGT
ncbi:hypothetical protein [Fodinicola feengrottensis]|uniref:hypothetical protein n=1 Tax=Fodinicola feengrottensis TaxID=435914 RepID=UPI0031D75744